MRRNTAGLKTFEGICAPDRRRLCQQVRSETRTLLDCRDGRPERRLRLSGQGHRDRCAAALLLVDPAARGRGLGTKLTDECVRFARGCGYRGITLWTHSVLTAARHVYEQAGFRLTSSEKRKSFGQDVVSEYWDMTL
jgi:GNAT superfamily N-acetyltransferase